MKLFFLPALLLTLGSAGYAQSAVEDEAPPPPMATAQATYLFSWTNRAGALNDPRGDVAEGLKRAQSCVAKIAARDQAGGNGEIAGCEGNGFAAGPGIYACDDPFTSHDYGQTLLILKAKKGYSRVVNMSGLVPPASGGVESSVTGNARFGAILYDFRATDTGGYALSIRAPEVLSLAETTGLKVPAGERREFHFHEPHACRADSALPEILAHWGDQLEFLSLTYQTFRDASGQSFAKDGALNEAGRIAALASNVVAVNDEELSAKLKTLSGVSPKVKESVGTDACEQAEHGAPRMCLSHLLFDSITGNDGTNSHPTFAWNFKDLKAALLSLKIIDAKIAAKQKNKASLMTFLADRFGRDSAQTARAEEAFGCVKTLRAQLMPAGLDTWAAAVPPGSP